MSNKNKFSAIQFIGTQRSGSNLLRVMLNQLPEISAPHPPHILKTFFPILHHYGNLSVKKNLVTLTNDICEWVNVNPVSWDGVTLNPDHVISICEHHTLIEVFRRIYEVKATVDGSRIWCCKSMESVNYVNEIEGSDIKPYYLHIYRDGRDVATSFLNAIVGPKHVYHLALKWQEEQHLALEVKKLVTQDRFISVKYEELIESPQAVMMGICKKLDVNYQEEIIMDYFHSKESLNTASSGNMWENVAKPILRDNHHKYLMNLTSREIDIFESVAGKMIDRLGYERVSKKNNFSITSTDIAEFNRENDIKIANSLLMASHEELARRQPQEELFSRISKEVKR